MPYFLFLKIHAKIRLYNDLHPHLEKIKDKRKKLCPELAEGIKVFVINRVYLSAILTATGSQADPRLTQRSRVQL